MRRYSLLVPVIGLLAVAGPAWADGAADLAAAQAADQKHDGAAAIPLYSSALASGTLTADQQSSALRGRALDERDQQQFDQAIADDTQAIALKPDDEQAFVDRASIYAYQGNADLAIADLTNALNLKPQDMTALIDRGAIYASRHDYQHALTDLNAAVKADPGNLGAVLNRAAAYHGLGDNDKAIADLDAVIKQRPDLAGAYYDRGNAWRDKGDAARAVADYDTAIRLKPDYADAFHNRGTAYQLAGQYAKAVADFTTAIRLAPANPSAYYNRGNTYRMLGEYDNAIADYDTLIYLTPNFAAAYAGRAYANYDAGRYVAAANDFGRAVVLDRAQAYPVLWLHLARIRTHQFDTAEFAANLKQIDPQAWPAPVAAYLLRKIPAGKLLELAVQGDPQSRASRLCDADFFIGEDALGARQTRAAQQFFLAARRNCSPASPAYGGALAALRRR